MIIRKISLVVSVFYCLAAFAQNNAKADTEIKQEVKISYLDSVKNSFIKSDLATRVDSLWLKELTSLDIYEDMTKDIQTINKDITIDEELPTDLLKQRLKVMNEKSPFEIEYNQGLENIIKSFLKNRKKSFSRLMALSEYYFPIFEDAFAKQNVPLEIKYLAVVESALNPKAVSKMGATGVWQFMYGTGKQYNLKIDSYIDERSDPLKSTLAASEYMSKMFNIFGDWELVLASYNSGPGNVTKAIRRSGGKTKYWDIRNHLPKETQGYVPAFLATMYLFEFHKEHGINPQRAVVKNFETDTIRIKEKMSFKQIADLLDMPQEQIQLLNPSYKLNVVPFYSGEQLFLRLPKDKVAAFTSNEEKIYDYVRYDSNNLKIPSALAQKITPRAKSTKEDEPLNTPQYYKVKKGDNLSSIARKYDVSITNIKQWNKIQGNSVAIGKSLRIKANGLPSKAAATENKIAPELIKNTPDEAIAATGNTNSHDFEVEYVVKNGDNLGGIAKKFGITLDELKDWNNLTSNNLTLGKTLIVSIKEARVEHAAVALNAVDSFRKKSPSAKTVEEDYYVKKGDSLYSISKKYPGVTISDIKKWNGIEGEDIKPGMKLKISG